MTARHRLSLVFTLLCLAACSSSDSPTSPPPPPPPGGGGGGPVIKDNPGFAADIQEIFNRKGCTASSCHGFSPGSEGLDLQVGSSHSNLVNVAAQGTGGETRVIPGDAQNSYLIKKLEGRGVGARMPLGGTPLDNTDLTNIRNWINQGASNN